MISTWDASIARYFDTEGIRQLICADCAGSNCGAAWFRSLSKFHTTAEASNTDPSWKCTPSRSVTTHRE